MGAREAVPVAKGGGRRSGGGAEALRGAHGPERSALSSAARRSRSARTCATQALEKYNIEKDIAAHIKKEFDKKYNPTWHCIVGRNFGSYVTHETKHFIYFYLGQVAILLFKSG
ncbi:PREDICTED: dynein light chain 1, cytoplasmic [Sturnus vulgaris]|uniref:dynein light chain 1, cytoplasmic n=1 Tax=Sturnus vulgaris TaxID=9172 RepID=UPI00071A1296|nr:PREDICTED: dynein light chain 1, cytoplasmic [Sturnus vulgaris]